MSIAGKFDVPYEEVLGWYCSDKTFEDILLALQTSQLTDKKPEELLAMLETQTWDEIWETLGLTVPQKE